MNPRFLDSLRRMTGVVENVPARYAPAPSRQMELPFAAPEDAPRYVRGITDIMGRPIPEGDVPGWPRGTESFMEPVRRGLDNLDVPPPPAAPDFSLDSPLFRDMYKADQAYDNLRRKRTSNIRNQPFAQPAGAAIRDAAADSIRAMQRDRMAERAMMIGGAAGAAGLGTMIAGSHGNMSGAVQASPPAKPMAAPAPAAPMAAPQSPGLSPEEQAFADKFKSQLAGHEARVEPAYEADRMAMEARQMLADLNARRRAAGGEVPDAAEVAARADAMLAQANAIRNDSSYRPLPQQGVRGQKAGSRQQAIAMIQALNADRQRAGGEVADAPQREAAIRQLLAKADAEESMSTADLAAESRPLPASTPRVAL